MGEALGRGVKGGELGGRVEVRVKSKDLAQPFWFNSHRVCSCHSVVQRLASDGGQLEESSSYQSEEADGDAPEER